MRKFMVAVLSVLMFIAFAGVVYAEATCKPASAKTENPCAVKKNCGLEEISKVTGVFKSIDHKKGELVLTGEDGKEKTLKTKKLRSTDVKPGDKVEVTCQKKGDECYAVKMRKLEKTRGKKL